MKPAYKDKTRMQISEITAQIIETEGIKDYLHAKKKAAQCLHALELFTDFVPYLTGAYTGSFPGVTSDTEIIVFLDEHENWFPVLTPIKYRGN